MGCGTSAVPLSTLPTSSPVSAAAGSSPDPIHVSATPAHSAPSSNAPPASVEAINTAYVITPSAAGENTTPLAPSVAGVVTGGYDVVANVAEHKSNPYNAVAEPNAWLVSRLMIDDSS